jgi:hypothetical protein
MKPDTIKTGAMPVMARTFGKNRANAIPQTCQMISANLEEKIMGGFGSGRGQRGKNTTSDMRPLDIRKLQRDGLLTPGRAFGWHWTRQRRRGGINPDANGSRPRDSQLPKPKQWWRVATDGIPRQSGMDGLQSWRAAGVVPLPGARMRAARGDSLRRFNLRLSALSQAGL